MIRRTAVVLVALALCPSVGKAQLAEWTHVNVEGPPARLFHAMAHDEARGATVLFGGYDFDANVHFDDTWEWDGSAWNQRNVVGPFARAFHAMTYDSARGVTVLFGGSLDDDSVTRSAETWEWDGASWTKRLVEGPAGREGHSMAYDSARGVTVLFGGAFDYWDFTNDTWEWDGASWTRRDVPGPSARRIHAMAYDASRRVTVLYGGSTSNGVSNAETWEWDGSTWTQRIVAGPSPLAGHAMIYDASRRLVVLHGGNNYGTGARSAETWDWDGVTWTRRAATGPTARTGHKIAYEQVRGTSLLFGGWPGLTVGDTWKLAYPCPADTDNDGDPNNGFVRDRAVTVDDLVAFLVGFENDNPLVDLDNGTNTGTPDNAVDSNDLLFFLARFEAGC